MLRFRTSLLIVFFTLLTSLYYFFQIQVSNTPSTYIPEQLESKILNDQLMEEFNNDDSMIFLFQTKIPLEKEFLLKLSSFTEELKDFENIQDVKSIFSYESIRPTSDGFEIANIINSEKENISSLNTSEVRKKVNNDRFVKDFFITEDLKTFGVLIEPEVIAESSTRMILEKKVLALLKKNNLETDFLCYGGEFAVDTAQYKELDRIMFIVFPVTFLVGVMLLFLLFNSYVAVLVGTLFNGLVSFVVLSFFGAFGWPYNMIGSMVPTLMMALSIAFIVHLYNGILLRKERGENHFDSIKNTINSIKKPSFYSALTTGAGLSALSVSEIPPVRSVGVIGGIGVLVIYLMVVYIVPPILLKFDFGVWKQNTYLKDLLNTFVMKLFTISVGYPKAIVYTTLILGSLLTVFIFQVKSESNIYKFFHPEHEINEASRLIKKNFVGTTIVNLVFDSDKESVISPGFHQKIDEFKDQITGIPGVGRVFSATDIIKQLHWSFNGGEEKFFRVPVSDELIEQYLFIYDGVDIYDFLSRGHERFKMTINLNVEGANEIEGVIDLIEKELRVIGFSDFKWGFAGYGKMFSDQENLIVGDLLKSVSISLLIILLLMSILWRSPLGALFCMIPNISPIIGMFIFMGVFGIFLDIGTAMVASVTVGIAVDDTIHIYEGFLRRYKNLDIIEALKQTYLESGRAIVMTSLILAAQFMVLTCTNFVPLRNFGLLTTVGVLVALFFDLMLLPALIILKLRKREAPAPGQ